MCTLSWLPGPGRFTLWHSRDERASRGPGLPPAAGETGGVAWIAPRDSDFGGTWAGINELGVALAVANLYLPLPPLPAALRISRGQLMLDLLDLDRASGLGARLQAVDLTRYEPFTLVAADTTPETRLYRWDRRSLHPVPAEGARLLVASAAGSEVEGARRDLFAHLAADAGPEEIETLYRSHPLGRERSVCLHRVEAGTRSLTRMEAGPERVSLTYTPGPPCETPPMAPVVRARRAGSPSAG